MSWKVCLGVIAFCGLAAALDKDLKHVDASTPRDIQIELAKQAGPEDVAASATIYVLGPNGYDKAVEGSNGFSCLVERELPTTMEPECYDAEGSATTLKVRLFVEKQRAAGTDETEIEQQVAAGYKSGKFQAPKKPGICYMLSDYNYVFDPDSKQVIHFPGHLMFYAPYATAKTVGAGKGAPYLVHPGQPDALMIVVPVGSSHSHQ